MHPVQRISGFIVRRLLKKMDFSLKTNIESGVRLKWGQRAFRTPNGWDSVQALGGGF